MASHTPLWFLGSGIKSVRILAPTPDTQASEILKLIDKEPELTAHVICSAFDTNHIAYQPDNRRLFVNELRFKLIKHRAQIQTTFP